MQKEKPGRNLVCVCEREREARLTCFISFVVIIIIVVVVVFFLLFVLDQRLIRLKHTNITISFSSTAIEMKGPSEIVRTERKKGKGGFDL